MRHTSERIMSTRDECHAFFQKQDDKGHDEGREIYGDRGDRYDRKQDDRGNDDTRDRKRKHDDKGHDEGRERYGDRGRYDRKRDYRGHDEGREIYRDRGDRHDQKVAVSGYGCRLASLPIRRYEKQEVMMKQGKDIGIEVMGMAEDKMIDTMMRVGKDIRIEVMGMHGRKQDYRCYDEEREIYWDLGDWYGRKRDSRGHDEWKDTRLSMVEYERGNPGEANTAPRVNIQELCEEYYEDILPIIMEKARHDRLKDVHARLDFEEGHQEGTRENSRYSNTRAKNAEPERLTKDADA
uniref:Reverse transcriptase domain-containing protein n=1 Tax=Tanacetum cinerariifolium TaxID=118510 RepID=A0A6L2KVK1_TANCI|nr:hypothetical protein [Tanacetum cinerariifolium]